VVGEAGIGKTRLVQEFCGRSEMANATIVQLNCHELFASSPLYPVASFFWARAGMAADDDVGAQIQKISNLLDELGSNSPENKQLVANLAGLATPGAIDAAAPTPLLFKRITVRLRDIAHRTNGAGAIYAAFGLKMRIGSIRRLRKLLVGDRRFTDQCAPARALDAPILSQGTGPAPTGRGLSILSDLKSRIALKSPNRFRAPTDCPTM